MSNSRSHGFSLEPIRFTEIEALLNLYEITDTALRIFYFELIIAMDYEYLRIKSEAKNGNTKTGN